MQFFKVQTVEQAEELIRIMPEVIAIDTEYVKGNPRTTQLLSVIVADSERAWAILPPLLPVLVKTIQARKLVFLQDYNHCDTIILLKNGCDLRETNCINLIDVHHLIDENSSHDLGSRVLKNYNDNYKAEFWAKYDNFEDASEDEGLEYECKDAIYTYRLGMQDIQQVNMELYDHVRKLSISLLDTELEGLNVNTELIKTTQVTMKTDIDKYLTTLRGEFNDYCKVWELEKWTKDIEKLKTESGRSKVKPTPFSFTSDSQLSWLLYTGLGIEPISKTKKGNPSTDYETLLKLSENYPEIRSIVEYKEIKANYSIFVEGMLERIENGRIYPHFNASGTTTGRISHSDPNMGNLPTKGVFRNFFIPNDYMVIIGADYTQLEVVIEANLTEDPNLLKIINEGVSKHDITAEGLGIDRNSAKTLNFALQYGAGVNKIRTILKISKQEAQDIYNRYWELYSGVHTLKQKTANQIQQTGRLVNAAGRVRHFEQAKNIYERYRQERQAYNFLIQGLAGESCNRAYYRFHTQIKQMGIGRGLFTVHDEIVAEVKEDMVDMAKDILVNIMEKSTLDFNFKYPLKAKSYGPLKFWTKT